MGPVPADPLPRSAWVQAQLKAKGLSFAEIGRRMSPPVARKNVSQTLYVPSHRIEKALARALGLQVRDLFPERYSPEGRRLHQVRGTKGTSAADPRNVEDQEAA